MTTPTGISGIISQIFSYIDRPWKAVVVVVLILVCGTGYVLYQHQDQLIESWLTPDQISLNTKDIPKALDKLAESTGVDLIQIWSVDLPSNTQRFVGARRPDGNRPVIPSPRSLPIITHISDARILVDVLNGNPVCLNTTATGSPLARRLADRNIKWGCAIPIPTSPNALVGVIYLAWQTQPEPITQDVAVRLAREISDSLAIR